MVTTIPMWVKCHNVLKELWTDDDLGFVASKVGIPFSQDEATKCEKCQKFGHETKKCLGDLMQSQGRRLNTTNRSGRMSRLNTVQSTGLDANNVNSSREGRQNERMTPNANASYENVVRNIVTYAGNGSGEDVNRRIWRVRSRPSALSEGARTSCIRNDRGEEIREQPIGTTAQPESNGQSSDAQGNGTEVEELNTGVHETGTDPSIGLQLALYVPAEITTPIKCGDMVKQCFHNVHCLYSFARQFGCMVVGFMGRSCIGICKGAVVRYHKETRNEGCCGFCTVELLLKDPIETTFCS
ncbi:hypothetical protein IFM89_029179 [Coptis chinensis]|uniref:DUF4283 domain-containing protein n=1 Tax=Coptis chinensis TaxID=261450 RepID=A0A835IRA7_9MAGN|nr:hypothetical protein IFM89_029179 [Coptis chinensis]